jgi:5'-nucleotidase
MSTSPKRLAVVASAALTFAAITVLTPPAHAVSADLVVNEVYGAGGGAGAVYNADDVELANTSGTGVSLEGVFIQYRSATGGSAGAPVALHGAIPPGGTYLIQMSNTGATGTPLPSPDTAPLGINMATGGGQIFVLDSADPVTTNGDMAGNVGNIIDMVGQSGSTSFETAPAPAAATATQSLTRTADDGDNNSAEFALAAPSPESSIEGDGGTPTDQTIGEIQGTGFQSGLAGQNVTTEGVVTAVYATGGLSGFYLQTEASGGAFDPATRTQSDGIFVYQHTGAITVAVGDDVEVTGLVREVGGETQIAVDGAMVVDLAETFALTVTTTTSWPDEDSEKENLEGMWYAPSGNFTITDNFPTNSNGELTLAQGDTPLLQPTEVARPGTLEFADVEADNAARKIVLDDGSTTLFLLPQNQDETPPYISNTTPFRTGDTGTFGEDVIFSEGASGYRFEPLTRVVGPDNTDTPYTVTSSRTNAPDGLRIEDTGAAAMKVASFNVLNYFTTLGDANDNNDGDPDGVGGCTAFNDRDGDGNTVSGGCNQRGAWDPEDFDRQQTKIVEAINALDADVVGLMEIENSLVLGETANEAVQSLVTALNADAGAGTWAANPPSPSLPPAAEMDVISNAIIYKPARVTRLGPALALGDQSSGNNTATDEAFANAREPIGQKFAPAAGGEEVLVVVNHFKSKGSPGPFPGDADQGDGQGAGNQSRIRQATALANWIPTVQGTTEDVLLIGDFNAYTMEDPLQVLYNAGYDDFETLAGHEKYSYSFDGLSGSLDHVLGNAGAVDRFTGADIWNVNSVESIAMEYSRYNNHATDFHTDAAFRASDHDPVVVGLNGGGDELEIQILGTNDFHGRLLNDTNAPTAGAAVLAGAVKSWRNVNPNTVFAAAGDLIGASTFESFIQHDKPTIDALNEADLDVSSVGNHEFDQGVDDLVNRVLNPAHPEGGAEWEYLAANVRDKTTHDHLDELAPWWVTTIDGVEVGFVGAVTEELPTLVSPDGIADIEVTDIVQEVNAAADEMKALPDPADIVVMLVHEGSATTNCTEMFDDQTSPFSEIVHGVSDDIDAIVSGHTHREYDCSFDVPGWAGREVT